MTTALLITGATGKQGGAVIDALVAQNADVEILAVTRNPQSSSAQKLTQKSPKIKLVKGDLDDPAAVFQNAKNVTSLPVSGVFSVQTPMGKGACEAEERQGKALVDEALKQHVRHFVYTSVDRGGDASTDNATNIPHFISKHNIEHHLFEKARTAETPMNWTVLRPVFFFDNIVPGFGSKIMSTALDGYLQGRPIQGVATSDIGFFAAKAFLNPDKFKNVCLSLAGDEFTYDQMQKTFQAKTGKPLPTTFKILVYFIMWMMGDFRTMFLWFYEHGYKADIPKLKEIHPGLKDLATWIEEDSQFVKR